MWMTVCPCLRSLWQALWDRGYISPSATPHPQAARRTHHQATQEHETQAVEPDGQNPSQEENL